MADKLFHALVVVGASLTAGALAGCDRSGLPATGIRPNPDMAVDARWNMIDAGWAMIDAGWNMIDAGIQYDLKDAGWWIDIGIPPRWDFSWWIIDFSIPRG
jgi:hypothetical protein